MKCLLVLATCMFPFGGSAQFFYMPLPVKGSDFKKIGELGITKCYVSKMNGTDKVLYKEAEYGAQGYLAAFYEKSTNNNDDSANKDELIYKYDGKGHLIRTTYIDHEERNPEVIAAYTYDKLGRLIRYESAEIDPPTSKYKYDAAGRLIEVYTTQRMPVMDKNGEYGGKAADFPSQRSTFKYDAKGRITEEWIYNLRSSDKNKPRKIRWTYDPLGKVVKIDRINEEGATYLTETFTYNSDGLLSGSMREEGSDKEQLVYEYCKGCLQSWMK